MNALRWFLFPFAFLYGLITALRNFLFDHGILRSTRYSVPVVAIGNLSMGGSGKSPMTEYLVRLLEENHSIGIVSRGYGRKTQGVREVTVSSIAKEVGDEPLQFKTKFPSLPIWVSEQRTKGIEALLASAPSTNLVLLDDAFQHRQVDPSLSILLMEYKDAIDSQYPLPMGRLREWLSGIERADVVVITKCPKVLSRDEQTRIQKRLKLSNDTALYFSSIEYGNLRSLKRVGPNTELNKNMSALVFTGIANPDPLIKHLKSKVKAVQSMRFKDHHAFSKTDLESIQAAFESMPGDEKILICTEKDSMRLKDPDLMLHLEKLPLYYLPIETQIQPSVSIGFDERIHLLLTNR